MVSEAIRNRKGARKAQDIPGEVLEMLNSGNIETVNLTEWLAIDQTELIKNTFPKIGLGDTVANITAAIGQQKKPSTMNSIKTIGQQLYSHGRQLGTLSHIVETLSGHTSDTLRCYAAYPIALDTDLSIAEKLERSKHLIADTHFGVREVVWMALRPEITNQLKTSIKILSHWAKDPDENIRRFTTESTRPRGVWCKHIEALKENPEQALPILEALKSDRSKYVQDSLGNWLNDASKSKPGFVTELCEKWEIASPAPETKRIVKRALRSLKK